MSGQGGTIEIDGGALSLADALARGRALHEAGDGTRARAIYEAVHAADPEDPEALHLLGILLAQSGEADEAVRLITRAAAAAPDNPEYRFGLGNALMAAGKPAEAAAQFHAVADAAPGRPEPLKALARALIDSDAPAEAAEALARAIALAPADVEAHNNRAAALELAGDHGAAVEAFRAALALAPNDGRLACNLGVALKNAGAIDEAIATLARAHELDPENATARLELGLTLGAAGHFDDGAALITAPLARARAPGTAAPASELAHATRAKLEHDAEQIERLAAAGLIGSAMADVGHDFAATAARIGEDEAADLTALRPPPPASVLSSYNRLLHMDQGAAIAGGSLDPATDWGAVERGYRGREPGIAVIDGVLNEAALAGLLGFCRDSTIWYQTAFTGEIGASLANGFCCPLLLQIAHDLRAALPGIFGPHSLSMAWAYVYRRNLSGLHLHADGAAVSLNLWLTPDSANRDPASGGLVIWDRKVPPGFWRKPWTEKQRILAAMVAEDGHPPEVVPYRCNRGLVFNSDVVHKTDRIEFGDGFEDRRINVTLMFGRFKQ